MLRLGRYAVIDLVASWAAQTNFSCFKWIKACSFCSYFRISKARVLLKAVFSPVCVHLVGTESMPCSEVQLQTWSRTSHSPSDGPCLLHQNFIVFIVATGVCSSWTSPELRTDLQMDLPQFPTKRCSTNPRVRVWWLRSFWCDLSSKLEATVKNFRMG